MFTKAQAILTGAKDTKTGVKLLLGTTQNPDTGKEREVYATLRLTKKDADGKPIPVNVLNFADAVAFLLTIPLVNWRVPPVNGLVSRLTFAPNMSGERAACIIAHYEQLDAPKTTGMPATDHIIACGLTPLASWTAKGDAKGDDDKQLAQDVIAGRAGATTGKNAKVKV